LGAEPRTVLVTGGAGYIGSHAAKALHRAGYRVVVFDNLVAGHRAAVKYGELVEGDIADVAAVREALRRHEIDAVVHFAAFLDVGDVTFDEIPVPNGSAMAGAEIVVDHDRVPGPTQGFRRMAADVAGASGHEDARRLSAQWRST
jgi:NAD(P)-dependent dehydrogenase (short-subunit alcohol dehydrogenase family)